MNMKDKRVSDGYISKEKNDIHYSRDYRYLSRGGISYFFQFLFVIVPVTLIYLLSYEKISYFVAKYSAKYIGLFTGQEVDILKSNYLPKFGDVYYVSLEGKNPSFTLAFFSFVITLMLIILFSLMKTDKKPLLIFITIGLYIHAFSSLYFLLFKEKFPYDLTGYSELYLKHQIIIWLLIMVTYWLTTSLITKMIFYRFLTFILLIISEGIFGFVRYVLYITFLAKCSYLFMAVLYFTFGFLFDFMIMVGFYSIYVKKASSKFSAKDGGGLWKWS